MALVTAEAWIQSPAKQSGLKDEVLLDCNTGRSCGSDSIPGQGNFPMSWVQQFKKKKLGILTKCKF